MIGKQIIILGKGYYVISAIQILFPLTLSNDAILAISAFSNTYLSRTEVGMYLITGCKITGYLC